MIPDKENISPTPPLAVSDDKFLCGCLRLLQPQKGHRAATDPVFLAAACAAKSADRVLDMGCGVGAAALCLGWRVPGVRLYGVEVQADYAALARFNAERNGINMKVYDGDITNMPKQLRVDFDHVIANPPYYSPEGTPSVLKSKSMAKHATLSLTEWVKIAGRRLIYGGWMTMICASDNLVDVLAGMEQKLGSIAILPLQARNGRAASRVIVRARKGGRAPLLMLPPLTIHKGENHDGDRESYTAKAEAVLRRGEDMLVCFNP